MKHKILFMIFSSSWAQARFRSDSGLVRAFWPPESAPSLEIDTHIDRKRARAGNQIGRLERTRRIGSGDTAEVRRVDIRIWILPSRSIQHVDRVYTDLEFRPFSNPRALDEIHIETDVRRSFNP